MPSTAHVVTVCSKPIWVDSGVDVAPGNFLALSVSGEWKDSYISCSADGYNVIFFYLIWKFPRIRDENRCFRLMGRIGDAAGPPAFDSALDPTAPDGTFRIGTSATYTVLRPGRLYVFANDDIDRYFNNKGSVKMTVTVQSSHKSEG